MTNTQKEKAVDYKGNLERSMKAVKKLGVTTKKELVEKNKALYDELLCNTYQFIKKYVLRSHKNISRSLALKEMCKDEEDIIEECFEKIADKLDYYLEKDVTTSVLAMYTTCNNNIIDKCKEESYRFSKTCYLDEKITNKEDKGGEEKEKSLHDVIGDKKVASADTKCIAREAVIDLYRKLNDNPDNLLVMLALKCNEDKPSELAETLMKNRSVNKSIDMYTDYITEMISINKEDLPKVAVAKEKGLTKILNNSETCSKEELAKKISNIKDRLNKFLIKYREEMAKKYRIR